MLLSIEATVPPRFHREHVNSHKGSSKMNKQDNNGSYNTELAQRYSLEVFTEEEREDLLYPTWLRVCGGITGLRILDVGCGAGTSSRPLARRGAHVTGCDASAEQIRIAREIEKRDQLGIEYVDTYSLAELPILRPEGFDLVTAAFVLHYAQNTDELLKMLHSIFHNLKPGGRVIALIDNPYNPTEPGKHFPRRVSERWADSSLAFKDGAVLEVQLFDLSGQPIPLFNNFYYTPETWMVQILAAGFQTPVFHRTQPPEQESVIVVEMLKP